MKMINKITLTCQCKDIFMQIISLSQQIILCIINKDIYNSFIAAAASEPEVSELDSILFGVWHSKFENAKHYGW